MNTTTKPPSHPHPDTASGVTPAGIHTDAGPTHPRHQYPNEDHPCEFLVPPGAWTFSYASARASLLYGYIAELDGIALDHATYSGLFNQFCLYPYQVVEALRALAVAGYIVFTYERGSITVLPVAQLTRRNPPPQQDAIMAQFTALLDGEPTFSFASYNAFDIVETASIAAVAQYLRTVGPVTLSTLTNLLPAQAVSDAINVLYLARCVTVTVAGGEILLTWLPPQAAPLTSPPPPPVGPTATPPTH